MKTFGGFFAAPIADISCRLVVVLLSRRVCLKNSSNLQRLHLNSRKVSNNKY